MGNYNGKIIYLGIDVHKRTYSITAIYEGKVVKKASMLAKPIELIKFCRNSFPGATIHSAYEAGFGGFDLHRKLEATEGFKNIVVNPASIEVKARERVKSDKRDSYKIAEQLSTGRLHGIHVPSKKREQLRLVSRLYETYIRHRHRVGCQIKSLLYQFGMVSCTDKSKVSKPWIARISKLKCEPTLNYTIQELSQLWLMLTTRINKVKKELALQAEMDVRLQECYESFPGVALISGRILANELEDMSQFSSEKKLFGFVGLTPQEYSSGDHQRLGHISHQGKPILRKILVQVAWKAIKKDPQLREFFDRIAIKAGRKRAIVAVARKILARMKSCLKENRNYEIKEVACLRDKKESKVEKKERMLSGVEI